MVFAVNHSVRTYQTAGTHECPADFCTYVRSILPYVRQQQNYADRRYLPVSGVWKSRVVEIGKYSTAKENDFMKSRFFESWTFFTELWDFSPFPAKSHETGKWDRVTCEQDIIMEILNGFPQLHIFHSPAKRIRRRAHRLRYFHHYFYGGLSQWMYAMN